MSELVEYLQSKGELITGKPAEEVEIAKIEEMLGVGFAEDYRSMLKSFGFVCVDGHEITGITNAKRLNVYDVTMKERANVSCDMPGLYVIEQTYIDGIVIWQSASGEVYRTAANSKPVKIADGMGGYLS